MHVTRIGVGLAALLTGFPAVAQAQAPKVARVREVVRVVKKTGGTAASLEDAPVGTPVLQNERIRTGGRSAVGLRFPDMSILRLGELSELIVTNADRRAARLLRGQVVMDFKAPGRITGGNAIAAVRGTKIHAKVNEETGEAEFRCYEGRVFVSTTDNPVAAGSPAAMTPTTLTDPTLTEAEDDWQAGEIRFVDGPYNGQRRAITGFNRATGTLTFAPALQALPAGSPPSGYLLVKNKDREIVELGRNMGTTVPRNRAPRPAYKVPQESFAFLERAPYFQQLADGQSTYVFPGTEGHHWEQELELPQRQAIRDTLNDDQQFVCDFGPEPASHRGARGMGLQSLRPAQRSILFGQAPSQTPTPERLFQPQVLSRPEPDDRRQTQAFRFEPYALGTNDDDVLGARLRYQAVSGDIYTEFGYRYQLLNGQSDHDLSEAFFQTRGKWGQLTAGRQHLFLGPANNTRVGTLLDLESSDTILYEAPLKGRFRQMAGYVIDSDVFQDGGFSGGFLRGQAGLWTGNVGYSVLFNRADETNIGWSVDGAQPVVKNVLDVYGEAGVDSHNREIYTAGVYVPALFHRYKLDVYCEYGRREDLDERVTLRVRRELGGGLLAIAFLDQRLGSSHLVGGGGILWSKAFR